MLHTEGGAKQNCVAAERRVEAAIASDYTSKGGSTQSARLSNADKALAWRMLAPHGSSSRLA
jgi:hypothetical protein